MTPESEKKIDEIHQWLRSLMAKPVKSQKQAADEKVDRDIELFFERRHLRKQLRIKK